MKVLDVDVLQSGIDDTITDIDNLQDRISAVQRAVRDFAGLDDALSGKGGEAIRAFYNDCHQPFLVFLHQSLTDYQHTLTEIKEAVDSFEPNANGYVSQEYLENDVKNGLEEVKTTTIDFTSEANSIIGSIQDIVSIPKIDESEVMDNVQRGKEKADHIVEELNILDEYSVSQLEQTKQDLDTMLNYLTEIESKFQSGALSIQNFNVKAIQGLESFQTIQDSIYNKNQETISGLYGDDIEKMPMSEIEKMHESTLNKLNDDSRDVLNGALNELKNGNIDRRDYLTFVKGLPAYEEAVAQAKSPEDLGFYNLPESVQTMLKTTGDLTSQTTIEALKKIGIFSGQASVTAKRIPVFKRFFDKVGNGLGKGGKYIHGIGNAAGYGTMATGFGLGMYEDVSINDKTVGEAVAHNATSLGVGVLGQTGGSALTAFMLGSNPVGWAAIAGGVVVGIAATGFYNLVYNKNFLGLQDELDYIGQKLDQGGREIKTMAANFVENTGEAIKSGWNVINPMNWGWSD